MRKVGGRWEEAGRSCMSWKMRRNDTHMVSLMSGTILDLTQAAQIMTRCGYEILRDSGDKDSSGRPAWLQSPRQDTRHGGRSNSSACQGQSSEGASVSTVLCFLEERGFSPVSELL